jgi:hypothetical protein
MTIRRVFVSGLAPDVQENDLIQRFQPFATRVEGVDIAREGDTGACRGFAHVSLVDGSDEQWKRCMIFRHILLI